MIPNTLVGLVVFASSLGPGYVFVRVAERKEPRHVRTQLLEAAELIAIGALASSVAILVVLIAGEATNLIESKEIAAEGGRYVLLHPARGFGALLVILLLSYAEAWVLARLLYRGQPSSIEPGYSVWHQVLKKASPTKKAFATVELRDRRLVSGYVYAYTVPPTDPETTTLALHAPIFAKRPGDDHGVLLSDEFLVLGADEIVYLGVKYQDPPAEPLLK